MEPFLVLNRIISSKGACTITGYEIRKILTNTNDTVSVLRALVARCKESVQIRFKFL